MKRILSCFSFGGILMCLGALAVGCRATPPPEVHPQVPPQYYQTPPQQQAPQQQPQIQQQIPQSSQGTLEQSSTSMHSGSRQHYHGGAAGSDASSPPDFR